MLLWLPTAGLVFFGIIYIFYLLSVVNHYDAPFVSLTPEEAESVVIIADIKKGDIFYDLGSGDGRLVIAAALLGARAYGVELNPFLVWYSRMWIQILGLRKQAIILQQNLFDTDISHADIICAYLLQTTNDRLEEKLARQAKPGARIIGVAFRFSRWKLLKFDASGTKFGPVHLYRQNTA